MASEAILPEMKFSTGAIQVTVWKNEGQLKTGEKTEYRTVSFGRRYKDKNGEWKSTNSLRVNDLPRAVVLLNKAFEHLVLRNQDVIQEENIVL
ncbi:MAG: hypothetical protein U9R08_05550 [Nanoarchaeota archaeon]|nr:hypothetical protein [Nanoarchaeota archaeon]